jgi:hypothetical protein
MTRKEEKPLPGKGPMPVDSANILSQITFWYSLPLIKISMDRTLTENDLWDVVEVSKGRGRIGREVRGEARRDAQLRSANFAPSYIRVRIGLRFGCKVVRVRLWVVILVIY